MSYHHLNVHERFLITHWYRYGLSLRKIAQKIDRSVSTISRELKRNLAFHGQYDSHYANSLATNRRRQPRHLRCADYPKLRRYVLAKLELKWPPEVIHGRLKKDYPNNLRMRISTEHIYRWIYQNAAQGGDWFTHLRRQHRRRRPQRRLAAAKRGIIGRMGIEYRPDIVDTRLRTGDWEGDTITGKAGSGIIATHVERQTGFLVATKLPSKHAEPLAVATHQAFRRIPRCFRKTLTYDNGTEFAAFKTVEKQSGFSIYFADPYSPWQRGCNENLNGLLRQFFAKGADFSKINSKQLDAVVKLLNNRPRKRLDYQTPAECLLKAKRVALGM